MTKYDTVGQLYAAAFSDDHEAAVQAIATMFDEAAKQSLRMTEAQQELDTLRQQLSDALATLAQREAEGEALRWQPIETLPAGYVGQILIYDETGGGVHRPDLEPVPDYVELWAPFPYPSAPAEDDTASEGPAVGDVVEFEGVDGTQRLWVDRLCAGGSVHGILSDGSTCGWPIPTRIIARRVDSLEQAMRWLRGDE